MDPIGRVYPVGLINLIGPISLISLIIPIASINFFTPPINDLFFYQNKKPARLIVPFGFFAKFRLFFLISIVWFLKKGCQYEKLSFPIYPIFLQATLGVCKKNPSNKPKNGYRIRCRLFYTYALFLLIKNLSTTKIIFFKK